MTSAIDQVFDRLRGSGRCAFIPYLTGGFPDRATCVDILVALGNSGADIIEVGIPFSDPLADGPAIQWASRKALDNGMTVRGVFELVREARPRVAAPIVIMTYCNPLFAMGPAKFAAKAREAGVSGVIVPDLPVDEAEPWLDAASSHGLDTIFLAAQYHAAADARNCRENKGLSLLRLHDWRDGFQLDPNRKPLSTYQSDPLAFGYPGRRGLWRLIS